MFLSCKCGNTISQDLYPVKSMSFYYVDKNGSIVYKKNESQGKDYFIKNGTFIDFEKYFIKKRYQATKQKIKAKNLYPYPIQSIAINKEDLLNATLTQFKEGLGCCGVSNGEIKCNSCKEIIGMQEDDCYQDKKCLIYKKNITHQYKNH